MERFNFKIEKVDFESAEYPQLLREIKNPPKSIYCTGNLELLNSRCIAVVGSRKATAYGNWVSESLGERLAQNDITVVSGMATGIDSAAHRGALKVQEGKTIAVLGCGIDICYPARNSQLRDEIAKKGLLISEYEPGMHGSKYTFPMRNRIISGLCMAVIVAEAGINSGSLITAERAAEQGREVLAVPGNINSITSFGCNKLISEGVSPLIFIDDIFGMLNMKKVSSNSKAAQEKLGGLELEIFEFISREGEVSADFISVKLGRNIGEISGCLSIMEIKGIVQSGLGKYFLV